MCKLTERTTAFWLILFACVGVIATAWIMEHVFEIKAFFAEVQLTPRMLNHRCPWNDLQIVVGKLHMTFDL